MKINVKAARLEVTRAYLQGVERAIPYATAAALTQVAYRVRDTIIRTMETSLDRPTAYAIKQAVQVVPANKARLEASVGLGVRIAAPGKGTPYVKALGHLFTGGSRATKRMEGALRRIGVLPPGFMVVPGKACQLDAFGNIPRGFIVQLLAYLNAFGEQGYKANMTDKRRAKLAGRQGAKITGVEYFVSRGRGLWFGRPQHLAPGIWLRTGTHGVVVRPVLLFVRRGVWRQRIDIRAIAASVVTSRWPAVFAAAMEKQVERFAK